MNIPNNIHFGLGFGFKYQYLLSTLLHALMTGTDLLSETKKKSCKKYMIKKLADNPDIHANVSYFMEQITNIFPNIEKLNYNQDTLLLLEGEVNCFEDINLFTTNNTTSKISFIQVKGSSTDGNSKLNEAIIKTLNSMLKNDNTQIPFQLIILINDTVTEWYYLGEIKDEIKMIGTLLKPFIENLKITDFFKNKISTIFDNYLTEIYLHGKEEDLLDYFKIKVTPKQYEKIKTLLEDKNELLIKIFRKICMIVENTRIINRLDHRLIYLFLIYHYGNDKLTKILWNIEMKSMNAEEIRIYDIKEELRKISFKPIDNIQFTKNLTSGVFKKGKIL
ncbi:MAG: hypothetical protein QM493_01080 [Sulfurovum sp.]